MCNKTVGIAVSKHNYKVTKYFPIHWKVFHELTRYASSDDSDTLLLSCVNGHKMYANPQDCLTFISGVVWEPETTEIFNSLLQDGDVVIDIGAYIGYFTLMAASKVGKEGLVFAFEPNPQNYTLLTKNVVMNGYTNVVAIQKAVSDKNGSAVFYLRYDKSAHSLFEDHSYMRPAGQITVQTICLDNFLKDSESLISRIKLIKMDVEGAEMLALSGMSRLVRNSEKLSMILEFTPSFITASGHQPEELLKKIAEWGFKINVIGEKGDLDAVEILEKATRTQPLNLLCYKP